MKCSRSNVDTVTESYAEFFSVSAMEKTLLKGLSSEIYWAESGINR
jgi:hypothetical protein